MQNLNGFSFDEEIRCDFLVTQEIKKLWAVEMDLALQLQKICQKHNIKYFAAGGTLLGAVRHKGFIPWDNDMDFLMPQPDYEKFCQIAPIELKEPYYFQKTFALSRIRNSNTTAFTKRELESVLPPFNLGIFIDIFPLYSIPDAKFSRIKHKFKIKLLRMARSGERKIKLAEYRNKVSFRTYFDYKVWLYKLFTCFDSRDAIDRHMNVCAEYDYKNDSAGYFGITSFLPYHKRYMWKKEIFSDAAIELPFETITVPVPRDYDQYLKTSFGNYFELIRN